MIPFATVSAAEEITEPTIVISTVEEANAGDEIDGVETVIYDTGAVGAYNWF